MTDRSVQREQPKQTTIGARLIVGGLAAALGFGLVGAMSAAQQAAEVSNPETLRRVVVVSDREIDAGFAPAPVAAADVAQAESGGS